MSARPGRVGSGHRVWAVAQKPGMKLPSIESARSVGCGKISEGQSWPFEVWLQIHCVSVPTDGDGCHELVVGYTDRVVRAFRWEELAEGPEHLAGQLVSLKKWTLEGQVKTVNGKA